MTPYTFPDARLNLGYAIVRRSESQPGAWLARQDGGGWAPLTTADIRPVPDPTDDPLTGLARTILLPMDTRDGDALFVYETVGTRPSLCDIYNLLAPLPLSGIRLRTLGR